MFPIFVVLPFKIPGGIGMKPKIIWTFHQMKEPGAVKNAPNGNREFPFSVRTCNNICADSLIASYSRLHLSHAALLRSGLLHSLILLYRFSTTPGSVVLHCLWITSSWFKSRWPLEGCCGVGVCFFFFFTRMRYHWMEIEGDSWAATSATVRSKLKTSEADGDWGSFAKWSNYVQITTRAPCPLRAWVPA